MTCCGKFMRKLTVSRHASLARSDTPLLSKMVLSSTRSKKDLSTAHPRSPSILFGLMPSTRGRSDRVRHRRPALAERPLGAGRGVAGGLMLDLGIELGTDQDDDGGDPHPHHHAYGGAQRAISRIVVREVRQVPRQQGRACKPRERGYYASHRKPFPARVFPARTETIEHGQTEDHHKEQDRPAQQAN